MPESSSGRDWSMILIWKANREEKRFPGSRYVSLLRELHGRYLNGCSSVLDEVIDDGDGA